MRTDTDAYAISAMGSLVRMHEYCQRSTAWRFRYDYALSAAAMRFLDSLSFFSLSFQLIFF